MPSFNDERDAASPIPYSPSDPDSHSIRISFEDEGATVENGRVTIYGNAEGQAIDTWMSYNFASDFLTPTDHFSFTIGAGEGGLDPGLKSLLKLGAHIRLHLENLTIADGYIDAVEVSADRSSGIVYNIRGRDRLGQALDVVADPTFQLKEGGTLAELLKRTYSQLGWTEDEHFEIDNTANRNAKSGIRGIPGRSRERVDGAGNVQTKISKRALKSFLLHQTKPYNHESIFHFTSRVAQRHGLWIWCSADGEKLIVGKPDFTQEPVFSLERTFDGTGNVLSGSVGYDMTDQPTIIIADSYSGGGEFGKGRNRTHTINPYLGFDEEGQQTPEVSKLLSSTNAGTQIPFTVQPFKNKVAKIPFRPMFLHDEESKTQEQLENFVRREMSLLVRKSVTASYIVEGHGQKIGDAFIAWAPDTLVSVYDEVGDLHEWMYVLGVKFTKQRGGSGTTTSLDLIRLNSIQF